MIKAVIDTNVIVSAYITKELEPLKYNDYGVQTLGSTGLSLDWWTAHWVGTEVHGIVAVAPNKFLQQTAKGQLYFRIAKLDVGIDNRFGSPLACHRIQIATHSDVGSEDAAETDIGITAKGGGVYVRAHGRSYHHPVGIVGSEGV